MTERFNIIKQEIEEYAAHMRALDRRRLNGVGIKKQGFIERALMLAVDNPEFLPHFLPLEKFQEDNAHFIGLRQLFDINRQIQELLWNLIMQAADMVYTDALEFYAMVREASSRRIDAAESIHSELAAFFESRGRRGESGEPTDEEVEQDMKALLRGKKDGKIVIENIKPKISGGKHKVIDEKFDDAIQFKETSETGIKD
jgi:hypothetical protein